MRIPRPIRLATTLAVVCSFVAGRQAPAQLLDPQIIDNRQPSVSLLRFIDQQGFVHTTAAGYVPAGYAPVGGGFYAATSSPIYAAAVGASWGGDGVTTVGVPDGIGRTIVGAGPMNAVGATQGQASTTLTNANFPTSQGGLGEAFDNRQPGINLRYAIRLEGIFPSPGGSDLRTVAAMAPFVGTTLPEGWAFAEGQSLQIVDHPGLFGLIGTSYGGDGVTTFQLPDLRGRVPIGSDRFYGNLGFATGQAEMTLADPNIPASLGGLERPFSNMEPTLELMFEFVVSGVFPSRGEACPCAPHWSTPFLGEIIMSATSVFPGDRTFANGQLRSIAQNSALFSLLGTTFGGNGLTTFALPNLTERIVVGAGTSSLDPSRSVAYGATFGVEENVLRAGTSPITTVPEPSTFLLAGFGAGMLMLVRRRKR